VKESICLNMIAQRNDEEKETIGYLADEEILLIPNENLDECECPITPAELFLSLIFLNPCPCGGGLLHDRGEAGSAVSAADGSTGIGDGILGRGQLGGGSVGGPTARPGIDFRRETLGMGEYE